MPFQQDYFTNRNVLKSRVEKIVDKMGIDGKLSVEGKTLKVLDDMLKEKTKDVIVDLVNICRQDNSTMYLYNKSTKPLQTAEFHTYNESKIIQIPT